MAKVLKWELRIFIAFWMIIILFLILGSVSMYMERNKEDLLIPFTSEELKKEKATTIKMILEDSGFTNIDFSSAETNDYSLDGKIKVFEVDHQAEFDKDQYYPKDVSINIVYYVYKNE